MFKSILPGRRVPSAEFTMVTPLGDIGTNGKENLPQSTPTETAHTKTTMKSAKGPRNHKASASTVEPGAMNQAFDKLLDDLQIPTTLRPKLVGMEPSVKAAMLKSSQVLGVAGDTPPASAPTQRLRRVQSGSSLSIESPRPQRIAADLDRYQNSGRAMGQPVFDVDLSTVGCSPKRPKSRAQGNTVDGGSSGKAGKEKGTVGHLSSTQFVSILTGTSSVQLEVEVVKKLRLMLRNEPTSWTQDFLKSGGYSALLTRLNELLEVEWREEQHDDQLLHELLRCLKGLSTSSIGCFALRSSCPTPFAQLVTLLFSDKKPGDVATRQLITELLLLLFDLYPTPSGLSSTNRDNWDPQNISAGTSTERVPLPHPHKHTYTLIRQLLLTPAPPTAEAPASPLTPHEFIDALHRPRIFKTYLQELSDVCRDYFWVFCHPNNTLWNLADVDEAKVEKPRAPGGMTGGVEFEAMGYLTTHFKLVNAVAKAAFELNLPKEHQLSAHQLHVDLFLSGLERIIVIARKASTTYYPTLHLELARYIAQAGLARFELPWTVSRLVGPPPTAVSKRPPRVTGSNRSSPSTPTKISDAPMLPSPRRIEPIKFN